MTFAVVSIENTRERVVGTIWAQAESEAQVIASNLFAGDSPGASLCIRRAEDREIPMRLNDVAAVPPFIH